MRKKAKWLILLLATVLGLSLSAVFAAGAAEAPRESVITGIRIDSTGATGGDNKDNTSLIVNLPETRAYADYDTIVFELDLSGTEKLNPFIIDTDGNYYEFMGANGITNSTFSVSKTLESGGAAPYTVGAWSNISVPERGWKGKAYYALPFSAFYHRASFDNYGNGSKDLTKCPQFASAFSSTRWIKAVGVRVGGAYYDKLHMTFGDVYVGNANTKMQILDASAVTVSDQYKYAFGVGICWLGCIGNFGVHDNSSNQMTSLGWLVPAVSTTDPSVTVKTQSVTDKNGYFDGANVRFLQDETTRQYQRVDLPAYAADWSGKALAVQMYDRSGKGQVFEPKIRAGGKDYSLAGATAYYVDLNYNLVSTQNISWSLIPPAGFCGYAIFDLSKLSNAEYKALESHTNENLMLGFHANWNAAAPLYDVDFGTVTVLDGNVSKSSDFEALLRGGVSYYAFASDTAADGLTGKFTMNYQISYGTTFTRVYHTMTYKNKSKTVYGRLDGLNFRISNPEDQDYIYLYIEGNEKGMTDVDYFSLRIADHARNSGKFEFFFYDSGKNYNTRSGINQMKDVYLFNKDLTFNKTVRPDNAWSWVTLPESFDGYMVVPADSIDWAMNPSAATYATIISQGAQGISNEQQGTLDTPMSSGFNIEFGQMKTLTGTLADDQSNFSTLLAGGNVWAVVLNASREGFTGNVGGQSGSFNATGADSSFFTPVAASELVYSYMPSEGIVLDATDAAGTATFHDEIPTKADRVAFYLYNEKMTEADVSITFDDNGTAHKPTTATLVSVLDEISTPTVTDGVFQIPDGFEGYAIVDRQAGKPMLTLEKGDRLGLKDVFALVPGVEIANCDTVFADSATVLRSVLMSDADLETAVTVEGIEIKRAVNSYYMTVDPPTDFADEATLAKVELAADDDNYIMMLKDTYPIYKSEALYEGTPTLDLSLAPDLLKGNVRYILFDEGEEVTASVTADGVVYVFADRDFAVDGFIKVMAIESFINGIDGRLFCYKKSFAAGDTLTIEDAYLIVVDGEPSEPLWRTVAAQPVFGDDIPDEYRYENVDFAGCPAIEYTAGGRMFMTMLTGGRTEPVIDNIVNLYYSDDDGKTMTHYATIDHPYETVCRVFDEHLWYVDGRLWCFVAQADKVFTRTCVYAMYTDNPDAEDVADIVWSEPFFLLDGLMNSKPTKLSDGDYIFNANQVESDNGVINVYRAAVDDLLAGKAAPLVGKAHANPSSTMVFTEGKIEELKNGTLWLIKRVDGNEEDRTEESFSTDGGVTWTVGRYNDDLLCGSSRMMLRRLPSGNLIYIGDFGRNRNRSNMTVLLSEDDGKTWPYRLEIDHRTWVSYPDIAFRPDGKIVIIYDKGRTTHVEFRTAVIEEADIKAGKIVSDGSSLMTILFKKAKYAEIEKVFGLPEATGATHTYPFGSITASDAVVEYPLGTTDMQVLSSFPSGGITVGVNNGTLTQLTGSWTMSKRIDEEGYGTVTFVPESALPWNLEDSYRLFDVRIHVAQPQLVSIAVTPPAKTVYAVGEAFDATGMVVTGTFEDDSIKTISADKYAVTGFDSSAAGTVTVTVTYKTKTATFTVTVEEAPTPPPEKTLASIAVTQQPTKTTYKVGETFDAAGLIVTATFSDESTENLAAADYTVEGFDSATAGTKTLTVTYQGKTATFTVTVEENSQGGDQTVTPPPATEKKGCGCGGSVGGGMGGAALLLLAGGMIPMLRRKRHEK